MLYSEPGCEPAGTNTDFKTIARAGDIPAEVTGLGRIDLIVCIEPFVVIIGIVVEDTDSRIHAGSSCRGIRVFIFMRIDPAISCIVRIPGVP